MSVFTFFKTNKPMSNKHQDFSPGKLFPNCTSPNCPYQMHQLTCDEMAPCDCPHMTEEILELRINEFERQEHWEQVIKPKLKDIPCRVVQEMAKLHKEGMSYAKIAHQFGITRYLVWRALHVHDCHD